MNEDKSETTGQRTDDPMLDHACTMRIALAIARRQNELDLRLHRIEQALKLGGHANFPSTDSVLLQCLFDRFGSVFP